MLRACPLSWVGVAQERPSGRQLGTRISTLAGLCDGPGPVGLGRVACFAVRRGARRWSDPLLLTSGHVLSAHGALPGSPIFAPDLADGESMLQIDPVSLVPIAEVTGEGIDGVHRFALPGEPVADYHLDAATARLLDEGAMPTGDAVFHVGRVHPHDALPQRRLAVRLLGVHSRSAGEVIGVDATVELADGVSCPGSIVIRSRPGSMPFAMEGDSGALVVDRHHRAVGLLWGIDLTDSSIAYACHLYPVLDLLELVPSQRGGMTTVLEEA